MKLSNVGAAGGTVTVTSGPGTFQKVSYNVAFGGTLAGKAPLIVFQSANDFWLTGSTSAVREYAITNRDPVADNNGKGMIVPLTGDINLFGITASPQKLRVRYSADTNLLQITGGVQVTLASDLVLKASLPGEGIIINTQTGEVQIRGIKLASEGDLEFDTALKIKNLEAFFEDDGQGNVSFGAAATIALPSGLEVGGSFKVINGTLDSIGVKFQKNPGILVAGGVINIYSIEGKISGLSDLKKFELTATVRASVGPKVAFAGKSFALAVVFGTIKVTPNDLTLEGGVDLVGGLFGKGRFKGVLTWTGTPNVKFGAEIKLYPGDIIRGSIKAYIDTDGNVDFDASIGVYVPNQIPVAGGWSLGELTISLRVRPAEPPANSYVSFRMRILNATGGIKVSFDANVHFDLEIDFFFFSISKSGDFSLRDFSDRPDVQISAAGPIAGTPDGRIVFKSIGGNATGQIVDLYADTDALGNDGVLIGSHLSTGTSDTTYVWQDMSTFVQPGQPVYVYAVIRDENGQQTYSGYSLPFSVSNSYLPVIGAPDRSAFAAGQVTTFSVANGNAIMVEDPRKQFYPDSELFVALDSGAGTLDFPAVPASVVVTGAGTRHMTLRGRQDDISAALNGGAGGQDRLLDAPVPGAAGSFSATLADNRLTGTNGTDAHSNFEDAALTGGAVDDLLDASAFSGRAILSGLAGNDILNSGRGDDLLFGGSGDDVLNSGRGNDIVSGGDGNDQVNGGDGHDLMLGGYGADTLRGGIGQDLLIGGALVADLNTQAGLQALLAEWSRNKTLSVRRANLKTGGGLNGTRRLTTATIQNDGAGDSLGGGTEADWFLRSSGDTLFDHSTALGDVLDVI